MTIFIGKNNLILSVIELFTQALFFYLQCLKKYIMLKEYTLTDTLQWAFLAGIAMSMANPFDMIRFRMQATPELLKQAKIATPYKNISDCVLLIYKQQGFRSFWKGNTSNLLRYYPNESMNFFFKNFFQQTLRLLFNIKSKTESFSINTIGGTMGGWLTRIILYPFDYTRTKMSNDVKGSEGGILKHLSKTIAREGLRGVYRGALISFYGIGIFRGTYFGIYDSYKKQKQTHLSKWFLSYFSYVTAAFLTYPTDTVRRRMMMTSCANYKYKGFMDCFRSIVKNEGIQSFFRGGKIILLQALSGSTTYFIFDKIFTNEKRKLTRSIQ